MRLRPLTQPEKVASRYCKACAKTPSPRVRALSSLCPIVGDDASYLNERARQRCSSGPDSLNSPSCNSYNRGVRGSKTAPNRVAVFARRRSLNLSHHKNRDKAYARDHCAHGRFFKRRSSTCSSAETVFPTAGDSTNDFRVSSRNPHDM